MTIEEFSNQFDLLLNSYSKDGALVLNEYEKSVFLTKAQEEIVKSLYSGNSSFSGFEETQELRRYLNILVKTKKASFIDNIDGTYTVVFDTEDNVWFVVHEEATITNGNCEINADVIPVRHDELNRIRRNPFRGNYNNRILRVDRFETNQGEAVVLYPPDGTTITSYTYRYLQQPEPIILEDLPDGLTISGISTKNECKLNAVLHQMILDGAVSLAIKAKSSATK